MGSTPRIAEDAGSTTRLSGSPQWRASIRYVPALDGLRAIAILSVLSSHLFLSAARGAFLGVDVFFVVSGFLITSVLQRDPQPSLGGFYGRRVARLMPALALAVLLAAAVQPLTSWQEGPFSLDAVRALTYTTDLTAPAHHASALIVTWSLGVEEQFYLLWAPLVLVLLARRPRVQIAFSCLLIIGFVLVRAVVTWHAVGAAYLRPWSSFDQLLIGAVLAIAIRRPAAPGCRLAASPPIVGMCVAAAALVAISVTSTDDVSLYRGGFTVVALAVAAVIANISLRPAGIFARVLAWRPLVWTGRRSYGIYLYQAPVILACDALRLPRAVSAGIAVAITFGLASLSWRFVEAPVLRWYAERRGAGQAAPPRGQMTSAAAALALD